MWDHLSEAISTNSEAAAPSLQICLPLFEYISGSRMTRESKPVWAVYDKLRTARLNVKYYCCRLQVLEREDFWIELVLLVTAPSSAVAGLWFWKTDLGRTAWQYLGVIAAIAAVVKPLLRLTKRIKDLESVISGYRTLEYDLREITTLIEQKQKYDASLQSEFRKALQREKILAGKTPETREKRRVKDRCQAEVLRELPHESFFIPEE